jgi:feruloyl-CoA synthase
MANDMANATTLTEDTRPPLRPVKLGAPDVVIQQRADGAILMRSPQQLPPHPQKLTERLVHWARAEPERIFIAQRDAAGGWRKLTYAQTLAAVRAVAAALLERKLSPERPIAILSGNDIEHALLALAAMHVGIPYAPISVPYSLLSQDFGKLKAIVDILTPGLVFAANGAAFARAIAAAVPANVEIAVTVNPLPDRPTTLFSALLATPPAASVEAAHATVTAETIAKVLFTSGSTGQPKGVINTQLMLCANQATGCRGITRSAATTISASCSTMAARSISTRASRCPARSKRPRAICAMSHRPSISTCPRASRCCCPI